MQVIRIISVSWLLVFLSYGFGHSQKYLFSDTVEVFGERVAEMLDQSPSTQHKDIGVAFSSLWSSGALSSESKQKLVEMSFIMRERHYSPFRQFARLFDLLNKANGQGNLGSDQMSALIDMMHKTITTYQYKEINITLSTLHHFFDYNALFYTKYNRLYHGGGAFEFGFAGTGAQVSLAEQLQEQLEEEVEEIDEGGDNWNDDGWGDDDWGSNETQDNSQQDYWADDWGSTSQEENGSRKDAVQQTLEDSFAEAMQAGAMPELKGPIIKFSTCDLIIASLFDSTVVYGTEGTFSIVQSLFNGNGGRFTWELAGASPDELYVEFTTYSMNTKRPGLSAEAVKLYYPERLDQPAEGVFEFASKKQKDSANYDMPRFMSFTNNINVKNLGHEGIIYTGGFSLQGLNISGKSLMGGPATMIINHNGVKKVRAMSKSFIMSDTLIDAHHAEFAMYHGRDSITHPAVHFTYYPDSSRMVAIKEGGGYELSLFNSSYFNMNFDLDMINWPLASDSLDLDVLQGSKMVPAYFESREYYNPERVDELTSVYNFNPLIVAYRYAVRHKTREFYIGDLVQEFKLKENALKTSMALLKYRGFVDYEENSGRIYLNDKAILYMRAKSNLRDYDDVLIKSLTSDGANATLHIDRGEMEVHGVEKFYISEMLNVYILPEEQTITIMKDRDFKYNGQMFAGNFEFVGRDFTFKYDSFLVDMVSIDSVRFYVEDEKNNYEKRQVDNKLVAVDLYEDAISNLATNSSSGTLYINKPDNKSGRKMYPDFPLFDAVRGAVVYFDEPDILDKAYDKEVYFIIPPFDIDSLSASDPAAIGFGGRFVSGGIFPDFDETLHIMPDYSLGFTHNTPSAGYNLYGGTGKYFNALSLDKSGIIGSGKIQYLTSSSESDKYIFYQDSVLADGYNFNIKKGLLGGASYPDIRADSFKMKWIPYEDQMIVKNQGTLFDLYNKTADLDGEIRLSAKEVNGTGLFSARGFKAYSKQFTFEENNMSGRHTDFIVQSGEGTLPLMQGDDIRLEFDLVNNIGELSPEIEGMAALEFPYAKVKTSISNAKWDLNAGKVTMTKPENVDISSSYFYSTREELDSLAFNAAAAEYDINTSKLLVQGVPYIMVADAFVIPENNKLEVLANSQIDELNNARLVIDTLYGYHKLYDANITIHSRNQFSGDATYQFVNASGDTFAIKFDSFNLEQIQSQFKNDESAGLQTVSRGKISEETNLAISPGFLYRGEFVMYARQPALELQGAVKPSLTTYPNFDTWINYTSQDEETQDVEIDFASATTTEGEPLTAGMFYDVNSKSIYATFIKERALAGDKQFFNPHGTLYYDYQNGVYVVEDTLKAAGGSYAGQKFIFNDQNNDVEWEGKFNLVTDAPGLSIEMSGFGNGNFNQKVFKTNALIKFGFGLNPTALTNMFRHIFTTVEEYGAEQAEADVDALMYKISEFTGDKAAQYWDEKSRDDYTPVVTASTKLISDLVFTNVNLEWNEEKKAWFSQGQLGLSHILRNDINAALDGFMEIKKTSEKGDVINIYIQVSPDCWYYFNYEDNKLFTYSSSNDYNDLIAGKTKAAKAGFGEYFWDLGDMAGAESFINRFRSEYLGINVPFQMSMPMDVPDVQDGFMNNEDEAQEEYMPDEVTEEDPYDDGFGEDTPQESTEEGEDETQKKKRERKPKKEEDSESDNNELVPQKKEESAPKMPKEMEEDTSDDEGF